MSEKVIRDEIYDYLRKRGIFCWKDRQPLRGTGYGTLKSSSGVSDILGILKGGRFIAVEVKTPKGHLKDNQLNFLQRVAEYGGIAMVATSVEDVVVSLTEALA